MFRNAYKETRDSVYGICVPIKGENDLYTHAFGSGFTIAPGILVTAAHVIHHDTEMKDSEKPVLLTIRLPDMEKPFEKVSFIAQDLDHDIALLRIEEPRSREFLILEPSRAPNGASCGSLGFPLSHLVKTEKGNQANFLERFQGSYISACYQKASQNGSIIDYYECESMMFEGSSGCPGFLSNSRVFGMLSRGGKDNFAPVDNDRVTMSLWIPSMDIIKLARKNGISV
ncbi:MAG TPA: serine protease [Methanomassiliicoccales archaeon]|jgi:hypothetical protein